uniref:uncharacterized protein LOC131102730 isoform X2 n=1 Tax=Doryrhamphus excisus TaxID=161450 RepID=UPI0025ADE7C7|nr:uncharacterized protein LOC131102730 isoform X2 [Doryrhamphus excisus]
MNMKAKRHYFVAFFLLSNTASWCQPPQTHSSLSFQDEFSGQTTTGPKYQLMSGKDAERRRFQSIILLEVLATAVNSLKSKEDQTWSPTVPAMSEHKMASSSEREKRSMNPNDKATHQWMEERGFNVNTPNLDCNSGQIKHVVLGKFNISGQLEANFPHLGHQAASTDTVHGQGSKVRIRGLRRGGEEELWLKLRPEVECGDNAMTLTVRRRRAVQLLLHPENESSVSLSQLPPQCGYTVKTTRRMLTVTARYNACHVTHQGASYDLPLLWRGTPVKMSCPVSPIKPTAISPSSLCCSPYGLNVRLPAGQELRVKVEGEWTPMLLAQRCGYTLDRQNADILLAAPFITCGIAIKDGLHTIHLQIGENTFTLACPVFDPKAPLPTHHPLVRNPPTETVTQTVESFPWDPPFYLAPPFYPHPTYQPENPAASTPEPTMAAQPPPLDAPQLDGHSHPDSDILDSGGAYSEQHSDTASPVRVETPFFRAPNDAFKPYYHYYHHPKIPHSSPPQHSHPGLQVDPEGRLSFSHLTSDYYVPRMTRGDSETLPDVHADSDAVATSHGSDKRTMSTLVSAPPWTSVHPDQGFHPFSGELVKNEKYNSGVIQNPLLAGYEKVETNHMKSRSMPVAPEVPPTSLYLQPSSFPFLLPLSDHPSSHDDHHDPYRSHRTPPAKHGDEMYDLQNPYLHPYHFYYPVHDYVDYEEEPALSEPWPFPDMSLAQLARHHLYPPVAGQQHPHQLLQHPGGDGEFDLEEWMDLLPVCDRSVLDRRGGGCVVGCIKRAKL